MSARSVASNSGMLTVAELERLVANREVDTVIIAFTDIFAMLIGTRFGRTPLSPISPRKTVEGSAGAGMIVVTMSGKGELRSVKIDPKLADPAEMEMLQDLLVAAHADAKRKIETLAADEMQKVTGGLNLPPGMKLPF